jgi:hypothetical protein
MSVLLSGEQDGELGTAPQLPLQDGGADAQTPSCAETDDCERVHRASRNAVEASRRRRHNEASRFGNHVYLPDGDAGLGRIHCMGEVQPQHGRCPDVGDDRPRCAGRSRRGGNRANVRPLQVRPPRDLDRDRSQ